MVSFALMVISMICFTSVLGIQKLHPGDLALCGSLDAERHGGGWMRSTGFDMFQIAIIKFMTVTEVNQRHFFRFKVLT